MTRKYKKLEELELWDDFMFGAVMSNKELCKPLLEMILQKKIKDIQYPELQKSINLQYDARSIRLDVYIEDDENTVYDIEIQATNEKNLPKRSRYYQGMIDLNIINKGEDYNKLKQSYVIFICTFDFFKKNRSVYEFENICVDDANIRLNDGTHKIFLNTKGDRDGIGRELQLLLDYFDGREPESKLARDMQKKVFEARGNDQWRREYMSYQMELNQQYKNGRAEGIEQGMKQGVQQATEDINKLNNILIAAKKYEELEKSTKDSEYQKELMRKYNIIE